MKWLPGGGGAAPWTWSKFGFVDGASCNGLGGTAGSSRFLVMEKRGLVGGQAGAVLPGSISRDGGVPWAPEQRKSRVRTAWPPCPSGFPRSHWPQALELFHTAAQLPRRRTAPETTSLILLEVPNWASLLHLQIPILWGLRVDFQALSGGRAEASMSGISALNQTPGDPSALNKAPSVTRWRRSYLSERTSHVCF